MLGSNLSDIPMLRARPELRRGEHDHQRSERLLHRPGIADRVVSKRWRETGFPADWGVLELLCYVGCRIETQTC
jgi:hypothetical protein